MFKYNVGDAVTLVGEEDHLYIVTSRSEFEELNGEGMIYDYELVQVLPAIEQLRYVVKDEEQVFLYATYLTRMWNTMLEFVKKERKSQDIYGKLEVLEIVKQNRPASLGITTSPLMLETAQVKRTIKIHELVNYSSLKDTDECLDRLNDLNMLIDLFKDDPTDSETVKEYIEHKNIVLKQLAKMN